jgi:hypothetical protein
MANVTDKKQVQVYLVPELHRRLKVLAAERGETISYLVECATRKAYGEREFLVAEAPRPYGRDAEDERGGRPRTRTK